MKFFFATKEHKDEFHNDKDKELRQIKAQGHDLEKKPKQLAHTEDYSTSKYASPALGFGAISFHVSAIFSFLKKPQIKEELNKSGEQAYNFNYNSGPK